MVQRLNVAIHTIFIGDSDSYPAVLDVLATETGGIRFQAVPDQVSGVINLIDRDQQIQTTQTGHSDAL